MAGFFRLALNDDCGACFEVGSPERGWQLRKPCRHTRFVTWSLGFASMDLRDLEEACWWRRSEGLGESYVAGGFIQ